MADNGQLIQRHVEYDSQSKLDDDGYSFSRETTIWHGLGEATGNDTDNTLAVGCRRAALAYPDYVSRLLLGIVGVSAHGEGHVEPAFFIQPIGPTIIEMGELERGRDGELFYPVTGGLLAVMESNGKWDAKLSFRWWQEAGREVFETQLIGFRPAIAGHTAEFFYRFRARLYRFTQARLHAVVMWMFHKWVRKRREELLRSYTQIEA